MDWMIIKRVFVGGGKNFVRGGAVSVATVLVMTVTLAIIGGLIFVSALLSYTLESIKEKVDVSVYFVTTASEQSILAVKDQLGRLPEVEKVSYTSREDILTQFRSRNAGNQLNLQALDEIGTNPFGGRLDVHAKDPSQYEAISKFLDVSPTLSAGGTSIVDGTNYKQNQESIQRLTVIINAIRDIGFAVVLIFAIASILIAFATIRLAIYTSKDEIAVMKLVGASNAYVQAPFVVAGIITGAIAATIVLIALWPATWYAGIKTVGWFDGFNIGKYYVSHFFWVFGIVMGSGIVLGSVASIFAIRKYLKV